MTYVIFILSDLRLKNRPTKTRNHQISVKTGKSPKANKISTISRKNFTPKVSLLGDKADNYNSEVNTSITFKLKIT